MFVRQLTQRMNPMPTAAQDALLARSAALLLRACNKPRVIRPLTKQQRNDLAIDFAVQQLMASR